MIHALTFSICRLIGHRWVQYRFGNHGHTICARCNASQSPFEQEPLTK